MSDKKAWVTDENAVSAANIQGAAKFGLDFTNGRWMSVTHRRDEEGWPRVGDYQLVELADGSVWSWYVKETSFTPGLGLIVTWCPL